MPCFSEKIAYIVPRNVFEGWEDPINLPEDKEYILETMMIEEFGLNWLVKHLENDLGHKVNIYSEGLDVPADVQNDNDIVIVSEAISSSQVAADYKTSTKPFLSFEVYILDDMGLCSEAIDFTGRAHTTTIRIINRTHPITRGLPETFTATNNDPRTGKPAVAVFGTWRKGGLTAGDVLADLPLTDVEASGVVTQREDAPILVVLEANSKLNNKARWAFLGYSDETPVETDIGGNPELRTLMMLNANGIKLLDQTIEWLLGKEPTEVGNWQLY